MVVKIKDVLTSTYSRGPDAPLEIGDVLLKDLLPGREIWGLRVYDHAIKVKDQCVRDDPPCDDQMLTLCGDWNESARCWVASVFI